MKGSFLFLGTGASTGVPVVGCTCPVCSSKDKRNHRRRSSGVLQIEDKTVLFDVGPDFREQALLYHVSHIDGVVMTHAHYDHSGGFDDLRVLPYQRKKMLPILLSKETFEEIFLRFSYMFTSRKKNPFFQFILLEKDKGQQSFLDISWQYISYFQAKTKVNGFRVSSFAYITDIRKFSEDIFSSLLGVKTLVISALRSKPSAVHFSIREALSFGEKVGAEKIYITHLAHEVDHEKVSSQLPSHAALAYDGLHIYFE